MNWYDTKTTYILQNGYKMGAIDNTLFSKESEFDVIMAQLYVDDIILGSTNEQMSKDVAEEMYKRFEMSIMSELTFFLGLQVKQMSKGIFIVGPIQRNNQIIALSYYYSP